MKYAVSVRDENIDTLIDSRFGRARIFALYDSDSGQCTWHSNTQNLQAAQGAGIQSAQNVVNLGAEAVVSGHCGPKAFRVLKAAGVKIFSVDANAKMTDAVKMIENGQIIELGDADVEGHWM